MSIINNSIAAALGDDVPSHVVRNICRSILCYFLNFCKIDVRSPPIYFLRSKCRDFVTPRFRPSDNLFLLVPRWNLENTLLWHLSSPSVKESGAIKLSSCKVDDHFSCIGLCLHSRRNSIFNVRKVSRKSTSSTDWLMTIRSKHWPSI